MYRRLGSFSWDHHCCMFLKKRILDLTLQSKVMCDSGVSSQAADGLAWLGQSVQRPHHMQIYTAQLSVNITCSGKLLEDGKRGAPGWHSG